MNGQVRSSLEQIEQRTIQFLEQHSTAALTGAPYAGDFSLHAGSAEADLYGMVDAVYLLSILGQLPQRTTRASREIWANRILACQDEQGYFSRRNKRGHSAEHATAYAIGALQLLEVEPTEAYVAQVQPLRFAEPMLHDQGRFTDWIEHLGFYYRPRDVLHKNVGWNHIWRSSHIGGGVAAALHMTRQAHQRWWGSPCQTDRWFDWYFAWLNGHINPKTGLWQRALWNTIYKQPTLIDMGGAVHFFWLYDALDQAFSHPVQTIYSTIGLQTANGLYKDHPFCIDLDGNFCIARPYLQLSEAEQATHAPAVYRSLEANFTAIVNALTAQPFEQIYQDSHGLPGALAALIECTKLPAFPHKEAMRGWQNPFDRVCWL